METKTKTFDCVEMKNRIQAEIMAEYETRKNEFTTFADFLEARARESEWIERTRRRFHEGS
jgi:hypothetical protein